MDRVQLVHLRDIAMEYLPTAQKAREDLKISRGNHRDYAIQLWSRAKMVSCNVASTGVEMAAAKLLEAVASWDAYDPDDPGQQDLTHQELYNLSIRQITKATKDLAQVTGRTITFDCTSLKDENISESERATLLKLILGMAIDAYAYKPGSRNTATGNNHGSIKAALQKIGLNADEKTISKYLKEAVEAYPDAKPCKS